MSVGGLVCPKCHSDDIDLGYDYVECHACGYENRLSMPRIHRVKTRTNVGEHSQNPALDARCSHGS